MKDSKTICEHRRKWYLDPKAIPAMATDKKRGHHPVQVHPKESLPVTFPQNFPWILIAQNSKKCTVFNAVFSDNICLERLYMYATKLNVTTLIKPNTVQENDRQYWLNMGKLAF